MKKQSVSIGTFGICSNHFTEKEEEVKKKIKEVKEESRANRLVSRRGEKKKEEEIRTVPELEVAEGDPTMLDPVKVREYEFKKLKFYFAVVECDSPKTAAFLYNECDGFEFESTSVMLDLRFIPDEMSFEGREIK